MPTLETGDVLISKYCTNYLSGTTFETCDRWETVITVSNMEIIEQSLTTGIMYAGIIIVVISMVLSIIKYIFSRLFMK